MGAPAVDVSKHTLTAAQHKQMQDPHTDSRWAGIKWTVYRGIAYDITAFIPRHPGGEWLVNLAVGRDCTALFESYHLRHDIALQAFGKLPQLEGFPVDAVPRAPYPADSKLYSGMTRPGLACVGVACLPCACLAVLLLRGAAVEG
jgi:cytochrome b involved in lipid metabolism